MPNANLLNIIGNLRKVKHPEAFEKKEEESDVDEGEGIELPSPGEFKEEYVEETTDDEDLTDVDITYPLVPADPDEGEMVYAWAHIHWNEREGELVYEVVEPERTPELDQKIEHITDIMERSFDIDFNQLEGGEADEYLTEKIDMIVDKYDISLTDEQREVVRYYTKRDFAGLGKLQPLMNDTEVEDISCDGVDIPVYAYHRNPQYGSVKTNIEWHSQDELDSFVMKLAQRCGRSISVSSPLLDGSLPDGSRVQATLATDIARKGSNFTIRRFTEDPLTPIHMMDYETENAQMLSYLWTLVEHGKSTLVCGTTGAGKTSQLNALSLFIRPEKKIVSIEDTPELRLPHDHWVPEVARSGFGSSAESGGEVSMDNLLKESLRQRPEYIIVGEVRGEEAYILFQQMATGHTGLSTIHADSLEMLMDRLTTDPINLSGSLIETLDCIMLIKRIRRDGSYIRRITGLYEVLGYDKRRGIDSNKVFGWDPQNDQYRTENKSVLLKDIADQSGIDYSKIKRDLRNKQHVLNYMQEEQIKHYREVGDIISRYYSDPKSVMEDVGQTFNSQDDELEVKDA
ncbi:type II/IV secretion system ATPase subunit [Candidatus Nanohalobium constans]|uniref:Archaeal flagellar protein FlaI n=1 Tax=Candidatus Nanohalobium constans TaxID=2565781 RepID=A0A5Q0UFT8_9ARCH|nr:type II/IV secretion system ATPase subunit [Candidatus Nanohalobium constans]QGA80251.1 archaeal flagellar protein FlaI [Candidatus Nanohalobium constans]